MTLEQAMSLCANAVTLDADEPYYRQVFGQVLSSLQAVSDRVEGPELGTAYVSLDGLDGLYRGEAGLVAALLNAVPPHLHPRVGVANAKFPAFVAARTNGAHGAFRVPGDVATFLAPHSIDLLPIADRVKSQLHRFGLHTMGSVASMNAYVLADRFGSEGGRAWELSSGIDDSPVLPLAMEEPVVERMSLPFHSSSIDTLFVAMDTLLRRVYARPDMRGRYAGAAELCCAASGWQSWQKRVTFKQPVGSWERAAPIVRSRLEGDPPRNVVEDVSLTLSDLTGESGAQLRLLRDARDDRRSRLIEVDRRLRPLMGGGHALYRIAEVAPTHPAPEMRAVQAPIDPSSRDVFRPLHTPRSVEVHEDTEGEPASVRLDRRWRQVARIDDRWTFDLWWLPEPVTRSYYRIDPGEGGLVTLFRDMVTDSWYQQSA